MMSLNNNDIDVDVDSGSSDDCICGLAQRATRIVGGQEVEVNEWPWQVGSDDFRQEKCKIIAGRHGLEWQLIRVLRSHCYQVEISNWHQQGGKIFSMFIFLHTRKLLENHHNRHSRLQNR